MNDDPVTPEPRILRPAELPVINRARGVLSQPLVMADRGHYNLDSERAHGWRVATDSRPR